MLLGGTRNEKLTTCQLHKYYSTYFKTMDRALKSRNAVAVVTCSSRPELRYSEYQYVMSYYFVSLAQGHPFLGRSDDFVRKHMWPKISIPSATVLMNAVNTATQGRFTVECVKNLSARKLARTILILDYFCRLCEDPQRMG